MDSVVAKAAFSLISLATVAIVLGGARSPGAGRDQPVDDEHIQRALMSQAIRLIDAGKTTSMNDLIGQLKNRKRCRVEVETPDGREMSTDEVYRRARDSVLVIGRPFKCTKCTQWHGNFASGFIISRDGAAVTNYHVVNDVDKHTLVAMTPDGKVYAVKEVLASSEANDLAILKLDGMAFTPLPLMAEAPIGSDAIVLSHPSHRFYVLTKGIISRYTKHRGITRLQITADYAGGSSGGPVLGRTGAVMGVVSRISAVLVDPSIEGKEGKAHQQMLFHDCIPASAILDLVSGEEPNNRPAEKAVTTSDGK